ncbi:MAG: metallophosphoesterase family protein [Sphingobacteriales bacterium]|nr:MAG: metallophosphoesterase family protein [Sphingobacteriales bacterium]
MTKDLLISTILLFLVPLAGFAQEEKEIRTKQNKRYTGQPLANLIRGPYLQVATSNSIIVRWRTDTWARSRVRYGTDQNNLEFTVDDAALVMEHQIKLTGLKPSTKYYYAIGGIKDTLQIGPDNYFSTLPVIGEEKLYRIAAFGDCGNNSTNQRKVRDQVIKYLGNNYMDAWILLGDNAYRDGEDAQYQVNFFNIYKDNLLKKYPLFPAPGNHDYHDVEFSQAQAQKTHQVAYYQNFSMPVNGEAGGVPSHTQSYYSFDIGNIHFLSLDSYGMEENALRLYDTASPQVIWMKKDLETNKNKGWTVAFWHHPPYTMGSHNSDKEGELIKIRENFIRILERYGVDLVLCGHSHLYERSKLLNGHYGPSTSFDSSKHNVSASTGLYNGGKNSCPYIKNESNTTGIVYVVSGSAGQLTYTQDTYPHKAMYYSDNTVAGAVMLEVEGNRLDLKWITTTGEVKDKFTMMKNVNKSGTIRIKKGEKATLTASFVGKYNWLHSKEKTRSVEVSPTAKKSTYTVKDEFGCVQDRFEVIVSK